jgi:hypothetical protein
MSADCEKRIIVGIPVAGQCSIAAFLCTFTQVNAPRRPLRHRQALPPARLHEAKRLVVAAQPVLALL